MEPSPVGTVESPRDFEQNPSGASLPALAENARTGHPQSCNGDEIKTEGRVTRSLGAGRSPCQKLCLEPSL